MSADMVPSSTQDCFSHDVCSYFNNATGGARYVLTDSQRPADAECLLLNSDPNCGAAFTAAEDDTILGLIEGCGQSNPTIAPLTPTMKPVCSH